MKNQKTKKVKHSQDMPQKKREKVPDTLINRKINVYEPVSIEDAIDCLQTFLESDLWSKFKDDKINGKVYFRKDKFKKETELWEYLEWHFNILRDEIKRFKK